METFFFGFQDEELKNSNDTLFICIVGNPIDWINSLYRNPHHIPRHNKKLYLQWNKNPVIL